ncbi:hypothetical protein [Limnoglobus roseus]|uniref:Uncharacterized protein n=1 Tax=Limnoglobus roseus TaxID=2598579 RepID=A0A5C1A692_9BACT|nr:hypothetical protein [Limnoglobus roseus]QEL14749.1 hypothetical protein PX52LOC_01643 [Limnoglobus roseus]
MQARKKADTGRSPDKSEPEAPAFTEDDLRITVTKQRRKSHLTDSDWPGIKQMLDAGRSRALIASDYDENPEELDVFIASCERRAGKASPGEALASPSGVASDAARKKW